MRAVMALLLATALAGAPRANALDLPLAHATAIIDGQSFDVPLTSDGGQWTIGDGDGSLLLTSSRGDQLTIEATGNTDPAIVYALGVVDVGAPSNFSFNFVIPILPTINPLSIVNSSIVGGITDFTGNGVSITAIAPPAGVPVDGDGIAEIQVAGEPFIPVNYGVDVGLTRIFGPGNPGALHQYGAFALGPILGPNNALNALSVDTNFRLSGGGDSAALTGFVDVEAVPEPGPMAMLASSLLGTVMLGLRRRRS